MKMKTVSKDTWEVFRVFLDGKDKEIIESVQNRKLPLKTLEKLKKKAKESIKLHKEVVRNRFKKEGLIN